MLSRDFGLLFRGSSFAHGTYEKSTGRMATVASPATETDFEKHLKGELGLGIIPTDENGMCWWGAIDIDIDTIDHKDLYKRVKARNIPLTVCRSKSGGAHLYVFFKEPHPASVVRGLLRKWASLLGYPASTEIFPKQLKSLKDNPGNWINLPYFSASNTMRYAVKENGSIDVEEFISSIELYNGQKIDETIGPELIQIDLMPPCLRILTEEGLTEGHRNDGLLNFAIFYRKSSPNGWEDKVRKHNQNYISPPLASKEVEDLIKSVSARQYQYTCDRSPICDHCDRKTCLTLQYGVGYKPWEAGENYDEPSFENLRKITTDPPTYILEIDSRDIQLTAKEFQNYARFKERVFELHDKVLRPMKQAQWELKIKQMLGSKIDLDAPEDASHEGAVLSCINDFLSRFTRATSEEELLKGAPFLIEDSIQFSIDAVQKYLHSQKLNISQEALYAALRRKDCKFLTKTIKGKQLSIWSVPNRHVRLQTEDFTPPNFEREEPEL